MDYKVTRDDLYLAHHGVLGMRWGIRRLSSASDASKKDADNLRKSGYKEEADAVQKVSDENYRKARTAAGKLYEKEMKRATRDVSSTSNRRTIESYNRTADEYNFNASHNPQKYKNLDDYNAKFNKDHNNNYNKMLYRDLANNRHYKKAISLYDTYHLSEVNELAAKNKPYHSTINKYMKSQGL
jgi:hypothetical protein